MEGTVPRETVCVTTGRQGCALELLQWKTLWEHREPQEPARWGWAPTEDPSVGCALELPGRNLCLGERMLSWDPSQESLPICPEDFGLDLL